MEVLQHASSRTDDLDSRVHQPGEHGWLPPFLSALQQSSSSESREAGWLPPPLLSALMRSDSSSESGEAGPFPRSVSDLLLSSSSSESGDSGCPSFEHRCITNLAKAYLPVPPPPPPARPITGFIKNRHILYARPKVIIEQSKKCAMVALEHYNKKKKIKFELMDVMPVIMMPEAGRHYTHVNFTARSCKEGSEEKLFFAELYICSRKRAPSGFLVTCCEPLGSDSTVGHKGFQLDTPGVRKNIDFTCCFGCTPRIIHPKGGNYIAGHCNIPHVYSSTC